MRARLAPLILLGTVLALVVATLGWTWISGTTAAARASTPAASSPSASITLITGDQVLIENHAGRQDVVTVQADRGPGTAPVGFSTFVWQGDTYVVPSDAMPYLGHPLAMSLFDVSALMRDGITDGADLPLVITADGGATPAALPGLDVQAQQGGQVTATEPIFKADEFGQALSIQLQADAATAHGQQPDTPSDLFDGIAAISLNAPAPSVSPGTSATAPHSTFRMQTLTINAIDRDGNPASGGFNGNGYMIVANLDNPSWFGAIIPVVGTQNWSVPAGDYEIRAFIWTWFQKTICFTYPWGQQCLNVWDYNMSFVWDPQIHVNQDTSVTVDARTANPIPIPTTPDSDTSTGWRAPAAHFCCVPSFELVSDRVARDGTDIPWYWQSGAHAIGPSDASLEMFAAPSDTARTGSLHFYTDLRLESPSTHHVYDLVEGASDTAVPSSSSFLTSLPADELAAIPTTYDSEVPNRPGTAVRFSYQPWESFSVRPAQRISEPLSRTEYVLADPASAQTLWRESAIMYSSFSYPYGDVQYGPYTAYTPGQQPAVTWFEAPRHPGIEQPGAAVPLAANGSGGMNCPACRDTDQLSLDIKPYVGADPQQWAGPLDTGNPFTRTQIEDRISLRYYQNGTLVSSQDRTSNPTLGSAPVVLPMAPGSAQYRVDYDVTRASPWTPLSTQTHTSWQFTSQAPAKSDPLPANWSCGALSSPCAFVPLLLVDDSLPLDSANNAPAPGAFTFTVHIYHQPNATSSAAIQTPTISVSYDDGTTWTPADQVTDLGGGSYQVSVTHPDPSSVTGFVSLRVQASDSAGSSIDQTIIHAYILHGSAAANATIGNIGGSGGGTFGGGSASGSSAGAVACAAQPVPYASCNALIATDAQGQPLITPAGQVSPSAPPPGYGAPDLQSAYNLTALAASQGAGQTVAVVDAPGDPHIAADLATYRAEYGLPACTTANGCLRIVNQAGTGSPPSGGYQNAGWGVETALDLDMVSAACPACHILLVVANSASSDNLGQAVDTAVRLGATVVSNSYGAYEFAGVTTYAHYYQHPGVPIIASSGDAGFGLNGTLGGTQYPASLPNVIAVGGTSLTRDATTSRGWAETAWTGAGSGCSAYFAKPDWQRDAHCNMRTVADVAAVADPHTGVAVYDSYLPSAPQQAGWLVVGGTSAAAPLIAGVYGLAGNGSQASDPSFIYAHAQDLYDVTSGSNGTCGLGNYLCNAKHGYDAPTGLGTPDGAGGF